MLHEQSNSMNNKEQEILYTATENLKRLTGIDVKDFYNEHRQNGYEYDGFVEFAFGKKKQAFIVEIKNELRANHLPAICKQQQAAGEPFLVICQYIPMPLKKNLKELEVNYLEAAGNCYINESGLFIFINDQQVTPVRLPVEGKLWKAAGLKFVFAILRHPKLLYGPYRQIAEEAGIALGNVGGYLEELHKQGFLKNGVIDPTIGIFIENKMRLIQRWAEAYQNNLRPKQWVHNFRFMNTEHQRNWRDIPTDGFKWGGENAAALLTNHLQPERFTMYIAGNRLDLMKKLRLVPDPNGNIEMLEQFWLDDENDTATPTIVPPILAYADLITGNDSRNHEVAERIKDQYLD